MASSLAFNIPSVMASSSLAFNIPSVMASSNRPSSVMDSKNIFAQYARSSCMKCAKPISGNTMGLVRFEAKKWHTVNCFHMKIDSMENADDDEFSSSESSTDQEVLKNPMKVDSVLEEFSSSESSDQKVLKNLKAECELLPKEVPKPDEVALSENTSKNPPKESKLEFVFSVSDVKDKYEDASLLPKWKAFQSIIFLERDEGLHDSSKIAAFDFDCTLVNTSVERIGADAWSLLYPSIPEKLKSLYDDGYKLVIFTNEAKISRWKDKRQVAVDSKIGRLDNFIDLVKVPMQVFIACGIGKTDGLEDPFRKPKPGMWRIMEEQFNSGIKIDVNQSFYVGDAAGRAKDHSDADIGFAKAIGLKFFVPEDYFIV